MIVWMWKHTNNSRDEYVANEDCGEQLESEEIDQCKGWATASAPKVVPFSVRHQRR